MKSSHRGDRRRLRVVALILRGAGLTLLSLVFIYAGAVKAMRPDLFAFDILNFDAVPWDAGVWIANVLPWIEIFAGVGVLIPLTRVPALGVCALLLAGFTGLMAWTMARGMEISCGCLGAGDGGLPEAMWRNAVLILIAGMLAWTEWRARHQNVSDRLAVRSEPAS